MTILIDFLLVVYIFICFLMLLVILMQRPKSEGLGTAFGSGFTENILGAGATDFLVRTTSYLGAIFFVLSMLLAYLYAHQYTSQTSLQRSLMNAKQSSVVPLPKPANQVPATANPGSISAALDGIKTRKEADASAAAAKTVATPATTNTSSEVAPTATPEVSVAPTVSSVKKKEVKSEKTAP